MKSADRVQLESQKAIRDFLKVRRSYDVLPLSFRLIIFDTALSIKESLNILVQNGTWRWAEDSAPRFVANWSRRHRVSALMGLQNFHLRRTFDNF